MAVNDYYVCRTQDGIYAGRFKLPSWVASQPLNTWGTVPSTNLLSSLDPKLDPTINPVFPAAPEWNGNSGFASLATAYCGWVYDYVNHRIRTGLNGGHQDYGGNDEYGINLKSNTPSWYRMRKPSGAIGNVLITKDGLEATGDYSDGQPRAIHSYNKQVLVPSIGLVVALQGSTWFSGQAGVKRPLFYNHDGLFTGAGATNTSGISPSGAGACYEPSRHCIYVWGSGTGRLQQYDIASDSWSQLGEIVAVSGYSGLEYLPEHDCLVWFNAFLPNGFGVIDLQTLTYHYPNVTGSYAGVAKPTGFAQPRLIKEGEIAFWHNSSETTKINRMRYASNPRTDTWQVDQYPVEASNSVTPSTAVVVGTHGRFFADTDYKIMGVINAVNQPIYFYRYE